MHRRVHGIGGACTESVRIFPFCHNTILCLACHWQAQCKGSIPWSKCLQSSNVDNAANCSSICFQCRNQQVHGCKHAKCSGGVPFVSNSASSMVRGCCDVELLHTRSSMRPRIICFHLGFSVAYAMVIVFLVTSTSWSCQLMAWMPSPLLSSSSSSSLSSFWSCT